MRTPSLFGSELSPPECVRPAFAVGLPCFYDEKVDLYLEGELQDRARTKFS
jgi:hypothetical protein